MRIHNSNSKMTILYFLSALLIIVLVIVIPRSPPLAAVEAFAVGGTTATSRRIIHRPFLMNARVAVLKESRFDVDDKKKTSDSSNEQQQQQQQSFDPFGLSSSSSSVESINVLESSSFPTTNSAGSSSFSSSLEHQKHGKVEEEKGKSSSSSSEMGIWAARGILLLVAAIWGTNFACVKYLEELCFHPPCNHPPSEFAFARFGIAALVSLPILWNKQKEVVLAGLECGLWIALGYVSQAVALETISAGECAFICSMTVVFVPVVSAILYAKPIRPTDILAGIIALSGVAILEGMFDFNAILGIPPALANTGVDVATNALASSSVDTASAAASAGPIASVAASLGLRAGDLIALGQPVGFGFAFTRIEHHQSRLKHVPNRVLTIAAAQCVSVGLLSTLWVLYDYNFSFPNFGYLIEPHRIATLLWTGIVTTVFAIYLEGTALQKASATDASIAFSSEPVWASMFGYLLLGERLGMNAYVGGTIIMMACLLGALSDLGEQPQAQDEDTVDDHEAIDVDFQN